MHRTTSTLCLGLAGAVALALALAPSAVAVEAESDYVAPIEVLEDTPTDQDVTTTELSPASAEASFLDLMYAAPHKDLQFGDDTTIVIAQTLPAAYHLESYLANGNNCFAPYDVPPSEHKKSGTEDDADLIVRTIVSSDIDANGDGIDDWYAGSADDSGIASCKIEVTDEFGNTDWKYIYINIGVPSPITSPVGEDFEGNETPQADAVELTGDSVAAADGPARVAGITATAPDTLPRTGSGTVIAITIGTSLLIAGAAMVLISRRRRAPDERRHTFVL